MVVEMVPSDSLIIRVDIPEQNAKKAFSLPKTEKISALVDLLEKKLFSTGSLPTASILSSFAAGDSSAAAMLDSAALPIDGEISQKVMRLFLPKSANVDWQAVLAGVSSAGIEEDANFLSKFGDWVLDESLTLADLFPQPAMSYSLWFLSYPRPLISMPTAQQPQKPALPVKSAPITRRNSWSLHHNPVHHQHNASLHNGFECCSFTTSIEYNAPPIPDHSHAAHPLEDLSIFRSLKRHRSIKKPSLSVTKCPGKDWFGGVALADIPRNPRTSLPFIVERLLEYLEKHDMETEGLFRLSSATTHIGKIKELFMRSETCGMELCLEDYPEFVDGHSAASILKLFLRSLPDSLLTFKLHDAWIATQDTKIPQLKTSWLRSLIRCLPLENFVLLKRLCTFFKSLSNYGSTNKMSLKNIATCIAPNILRLPNDETISNANLVNNVVNDLLKDADILFDYNHSAESPEFWNSDLFGVIRAKFSVLPHETRQDELAFEKGDFMFLLAGDKDAPADRKSGWLRAEVIGKGTQSHLVGFVLSDYFEMIASPIVSLFSTIQMSRNDLICIERPIVSDVSSQTELSQSDSALKTMELIKETTRLKQEIQRLKLLVTPLDSGAKENEPIDDQFQLRNNQLPIFARPKSFTGQSSPPPVTSQLKKPKRGPPPAPPVTHGNFGRHAADDQLSMKSLDSTFRRMNMRSSAPTTPPPEDAVPDPCYENMAEFSVEPPPPLAQTWSFNHRQPCQHNTFNMPMFHFPPPPQIPPNRESM